MPHGYHGRILHVELSKQSVRVEEPDEIFWRTYVGGGLLGTRLLLDHVPAGADAVGPDNILVFASSVVAGTPAPAMARFSTVAKSPLTGGVGETRTEGPFGPALKGSGYDAIVFHGTAERLTSVTLQNREVRFEDARYLAGADVGTTTAAIVDVATRGLSGHPAATAAFGGAAKPAAAAVGPQTPEVHVAAIGPAGENLVRFASIVTDRGYQASRMGMGAVMGSKKLKAVALVGHPAPPEIADPESVRQIAHDFSAGITKNDLTRWQAEPPGFSCWVYLHGLDAALSVNNYRAGELAGIENYSEQQFLDREIEELGCPDCPVGCIKSIRPRRRFVAVAGDVSATDAQAPAVAGATGPGPIESGATDTDTPTTAATTEGAAATVGAAGGGGAPSAADYAIHQEATGALGVNLGLTDLDAVLEASHLCNHYGMDPTSLGYTLSAAMEMKEAGVVDAAAHGVGAEAGTGHQAAPAGTAAGIAADEIPAFGDAAGVLRLIRAVALREGVGDLLAEGSRRFAARVGGTAPDFAMHVKGLEMVPFEPRSQTNLALGYAVAPIGPRYDICEHDWDFDTEVGWEHTLRYSRTLGILERIPMDYLGPEKVRNFKALFTLWSAADALDMCIFGIAPTRLLSLDAMSRLVAAITGWETSSHEVMKIGERRLHLMRAYNSREGIGPEQDTLPERFFTEPIVGSKRAGDVLDKTRFYQSVATLYRMMGWDTSGVPTEATMVEAGLGPRYSSDG